MHLIPMADLILIPMGSQPSPLPCTSLVCLSTRISKTTFPNYVVMARSVLRFSDGDALRHVLPALGRRFHIMEQIGQNQRRHLFRRNRQGTKFADFDCILLLARQNTVWETIDQSYGAV